MKTISSVMVFLILTILACADITVEPSKGDRFSYYLNGDVWEGSITHKTKFVLKVFMSEELGKHV